MGKWDLRAELLLSCLGADRKTQAYRYLTEALGMVMDGAQPGPEFWAALGLRFGRRGESVRNVCSTCVRTAYERDLVQFCEILDGLYFTPLRLREFFNHRVQVYAAYGGERGHGGIEIAPNVRN